MKLLAKYQDDQYPKQTITHVRKTVRAIVFNNDKKIALHHLDGHDDFGYRNYYETPGGGVKKGERLIDALKREIKEELGASIKNIKPVGRIVDYYNLIGQCNNIFYYMCEVDDDNIGKHFDDYENVLIKETVWVDIDTALKLMENMNKAPLEILVARKDSLILKTIKEKYIEMF